MLDEQKVDIALFTETWYSDDKQHQFETSDLNQNGYNISVVNRQNRIGGGIALTCRTGVNMRRLKAGMTRSFEHGIWQLIFKNITLTVIGIYRPPSLATSGQFVTEFVQFMEGIIPQYSNLMIMGDFNLHVHESSSAMSEFNESMFAMGLEQHVNFSTHVGGNTLDLVITEATNGIEVLSYEPGPFLSDHCAVKIVTNVKKENITSKMVKFRNFKDMDNSAFANDLSELSIDSENVNTFVENFEDKIKRVVDRHAPLKEKMKICRVPKPWFTENILILKRLLRKSERLWKRYKQPHQYEAFKAARNKYNYELNREKRLTFSQKVSDSKGDSRKLYQLVSELTGKRSDNPLPISESEKTIADKFADHFMNKIDIIRKSLEDYENFSPDVRDVPRLDSFQDLTEVEVRKLINALQTKTSDLDILPTKILKSFLKELLPLVTKLVNLSLKQGIFPSKWKQAIVRPLLKKVGLELEFANYRPVSNLAFLSKLIEKAVLFRLNVHVDNNNLLPKNQSAYRRFNSCESALLRLV